MWQQLHSLLSLHTHLAWDQGPKDRFLWTDCLFVCLVPLTFVDECFCEEPNWIFCVAFSFVCLSQLRLIPIRIRVGLVKGMSMGTGLYGIGIGYCESMGGGTGLSDKRLELYVAETGHTTVWCVGVVVVLRQSQIKVTVQENSAHRLLASSLGGLLGGDKKGWKK